MDRFHSVTVRMAKRQNLSLNPTKISGLCGRLMCCLSHEVGLYPADQR
jgi:cell fate regulator YaaT (PSP1 superfamily)